MIDRKALGWELKSAMPQLRGHLGGDMSDDKRFWSKVDASGDCWEWLAGRNPKGYGRFWRAGHMFMAHRYSYALLVGHIPAKRQIDHLCRNPGCVNPDHMELVTSRENTMRGHHRNVRLSRSNACLRGHSLTDANVLGSNEGRRCRRCNREQSRLRRQRVAA